MNEIYISGFTFVRNAVRFGYPVIESISSLLPLCDEVVIAAGKSDDATIELLKSIGNNKIQLLETEWNEKLRSDGLIYSQQTDIALSNCKGNWCIYLQADEVLHEDDYQTLRDEIYKANNDTRVEALLFRYIHFYGSYNYFGTGRKWYRREIRAFKNSGSVFSYLDAQGFRKHTANGVSKLRARQTDVKVFHYGWVRQPNIQSEKISESKRYYHNLNISNYNFEYKITGDLKKFTGTHPSVMNNIIISNASWIDDFDKLIESSEQKKIESKSLINRLSDWFEKKTGIRIGEYKDFIEVK